MVLEQVSRPASNLRNFHWCTKINWVPHKSWYYCLAPSGLCSEKSIWVWCTQRNCTCWSGECLNWFDCELKCFAMFLQVHSRILWIISCSWRCNMENPIALTPIILTPFNCIYWRDDMQIVLRNKGLYKVTMGKEVEPQQHLEKSRYLNKLDEAFGFMCIHISR